MSNAKVELLGANELIGQFRKLESEVATSYISDAIEAGAGVFFDAIERAAPVATGTLAGAVEVSVIEQSRNRVVWGIFIGPEAFYWRFLNYGTRYITAIPFISKSLKNRRSTARQTIRDTFRDKMGGFS